MNGDFEQFWLIFPRKVAKADARKAWKQTEGIRPDMDILLSKLKLQTMHEDWQRDGGRYIPYPASWLRGERWEDMLTIELPKLPTARRPDKYDKANEAFDPGPGVDPETRARVAEKLKSLRIKGAVA